jgi:hypothetical protein
MRPLPVAGLIGQALPLAWNLLLFPISIEQPGCLAVKHHRVESPKKNASRQRNAVDTKRQMVLRAGERLYGSIQAELERDHYGSYVVINTQTAEYVLGPTLSQAHGDFIQRFGKDTPGWCTRIGASIFATI